jgi:hypothetical protein
VTTRPWEFIAAAIGAVKQCSLPDTPEDVLIVQIYPIATKPARTKTPRRDYWRSQLTKLICLPDAKIGRGKTPVLSN